MVVVLVVRSAVIVGGGKAKFSRIKSLVLVLVVVVRCWFPTAIAGGSVA